MRLKALIFDVDGTLADNEEAHRCAFNAAFEQLELGWNWSKPMYAHLLKVAGGKERLGAYIDSLQLPESDSAALKQRIQHIHDTKTVYYTRSVAQGKVPLRQGVARLIEEAGAASLKLAIASATTLTNVEALLRSNLGADAMRRFAVFGCDNQVPRKKPAPDIYHWVLGELRESAADCAAVEDSSNGVRAAKAAGLFTIATPSYWTRDEDLSPADLLLPSLGSAAQPLPPAAARLAGNSVLGLREIEQLMQGGSDERARQNHH